MSATFDATTTAEYAAATTAAARSAVIVAALTGTISVKVFNGSNVEKGSGTMAAPWAVASGATVTVGEVSSFTVGGTATPDANWYIRFQNAGVTRWVRGSFGLADSGQDFTWSLATWEAGQTGTIGTATITTTGNTAPFFVDPPTYASVASTGGTIQFNALDPEGATVTYSMAYRNGFSISPTTGLVTVTSAAAGTTGNITVTASDGVLSTPTVCAVTVEATSGGGGTSYTGSGTNAIYTGNWFSGEDTVTGWDWSLPANAVAATRSGVFTWTNTAHPSYWQGKKIKIVNARWRDLEPTAGNYDLSTITGPLADTSWDGVFLNVRGFVTIPASGFDIEKTAPSWMISNPGTYPVYTLNGTTSLLMRNANVKAKHLALITAIANAGILSNTRLWQQIIHLPGSTSGEEFNTTQGSPTADYAAAKEYITAWGNAAGENKTKLMWTDDYGQVEDVLIHAQSTVGTGTRGGFIEGWLWNQYSPGETQYTGQTYTDGTLNASGVYVGGHLGVDENQVCIASRGWHDQNEARGSYSDPTVGLQQQNYRMAHLRAMQMRRKILWVRDGYSFNPRMDNWVSMNAGHTAATANDAWCCLMRSWTRSNYNGTGTYTREVNNFEKWLYQREAVGATTTPSAALKVFHGWNITKSTGLPSTEWYINLARLGTNIQFSLDTAFLSGARSIAVKVTWYDSSTEKWSIVYNRASGGTLTKEVTGGATNLARTHTFFLGDFTAASSIDFRLTSGGNTPFMFVRVIKV